MREYKFRGKRTGNGEWVYGYYVGPVAGDNSHEICDIKSVCGNRTDVIPETVGQYTGLKTKDIETYKHDVIGFYVIENLDEPDEVKIIVATAQIVWNDDYGCWDLKWLKGSQNEMTDICDIGIDDSYDYLLYNLLEYFDNESSQWNGYEIIGNIYDNPELSEGK